MQKEKMKKENVTGLNQEEAVGRRFYRRRGRGVVFGTMLILAGVVFFLNTMGLLSWNIWDYIWQFWPILFILWGLQMVLGDSRFARIIIVIITLLLLLAIVAFAVSKVNSGAMQYMPGNMRPMFLQMGGNST